MEHKEKFTGNKFVCRPYLFLIFILEFKKNYYIYLKKKNIYIYIYLYIFHNINQPCSKNVQKSSNISGQNYFIFLFFLLWQKRIEKGSGVTTPSVERVSISHKRDLFKIPHTGDTKYIDVCG